MKNSEIFTRDLSSGRIHRRVVVDGKAYSLEQDNLDDAGDYEVVTDISDAEPEQLCRNCFPAKQDQQTE